MADATSVRDDPTRAINEARAHADPADRILAIGRLLGDQGLKALMADLLAERTAAVQEMAATGMSYAAIGRKVGLTRSRVEQLAKGRGARPGSHASLAGQRGVDGPGSASSNPARFNGTP